MHHQHLDFHIFKRYVETHRTFSRATAVNREISTEINAG